MTNTQKQEPWEKEFNDMFIITHDGEEEWFTGLEQENVRQFIRAILAKREAEMVEKIDKLIDEEVNKGAKEMTDAYIMRLGAMAEVRSALSKKD